jgi:hypothetical protein
LKVHVVEDRDAPASLSELGSRQTCAKRKNGKSQSENARTVRDS